LSRPDVSAALLSLEREVAEEKAATLGRLTRAFERALDSLRRFDAGEDENSAVPETRRDELLDAAAGALWCFVVQREACGLRNTEAVLREYRISPELRLRMGVSRKRGPG
jgi:hypothetical protein